MAELSKIFTHGNLAYVTIGMWTGQKLLTPEDLGLKGTDISSAFSLGKKNLIPASVIAELRAIDGKARHTLLNYSFDFPIGAARFVPKTSVVKFVEEMDVLVKRFNEKADELAANYSKYRLEMRTEYIDAAKEAYERAKSLSPSFDKTENEFVNEFIARIEQSYPKVQDIRKKFHMEYYLYKMDLPDVTQAKYEDLMDEGNRIRMMEDAFNRKLSKKVESFVDDCTSGLRTKAAEVLSNFSDALGGNKRISEATINSVRNMIEDFERRNFVGDDVMIKHLTDFRTNILNCFTAESMRTSKVVRKKILADLKSILKIATDESAIQEIARRYRMKIGI